MAPQRFNRFKPRKAFRKGMTKALASKAYVDKKLSASKELKWLCTEVSSTATSGDWVALLDRVQDIDQGDTAADRDGNMIQQLGIRMRVQIACAGDRPESVRLIALEKKKNYSTTTDLPGQGGAGVREMVGCFTPDMLANYNVLLDKTYTIVPHQYNRSTAPVDGNTQFRHIYDDLYFKRRRKLQYEGSLGTSLELGKISLYAVSDNLGTGTDYPDVAIDVLTYFKEI